MDDLSRQLGACKTGCMVGDMVINHFLYADDLTILSPSSNGFQQLLNICSDYGVEFDIKYNAKKSGVMICRTKDDLKIKFPPFCLSGMELGRANTTKYLGHILTDTPEDDADTGRQRRELYVQANMLVRRFHHCTTDVKVNLFRTYCSPLD